MSVEKRMMVAVAVSFVVIVVWSMVFMPAKPKPPEPVQQQEQQQDTTGSETLETDTNDDSNEEASEYSLEFAEDEEPVVTVAESERTVEVETDLFRVSLSNAAGGSALHWLLIDGYKASFSEEPLDLVAPEQYRRSGHQPLATLIRNRDGNFVAMPGMPKIEADTDDGKVVFDDSGRATVRFYYYDEKVGEIIKQLTFYRDSYIVDVEFQANLKIKNAMAVMLLGPGVGELLKPSGDKLSPGKEGNGFLRRKTEGGPVHIPSFVAGVGAPKEGSPEFIDKGSEYAIWAGLENNYFMTLAFGDSGTSLLSTYQMTGIHKLTSEDKEKHFSFPYVMVKPTENNTLFKLYVGPKDMKVLEGEANGRLKDVIKFGWFGFVSKPALWLLQQINNVVHNYGFAIIFLTIIIQVLLLPLAIKQRKSMQSMQRLQPQIKQIQARYKAEKGDDIKTRQAKKTKLNEETMALYKSEGVNPMGGCLPLLIQMPILIAFFDMFRVAIELRRAPFILWWQNMAVADTTFILPVAMGVVMFLSQKMTPAPAAAQSGAMKFLPFIFVFLFAQAPSGLVLYWTVSSLFGLGTQMVMNAISPPPAVTSKGKTVHTVAAKKKKKKSGR